MKELRQQRITIELGRGRTRHYTRTVYGAHLTGHVAKTWGNTPMHQWKGSIILNCELVEVWGYSHLPELTPEGDFGWSNDTY